MPTKFICQHARKGKLKIIHLSRHSGGVSEHIYFSVAPSTIKRTFRVDDLWTVVEDETGIHLTPVSRAGTNGVKRV